MPRKSAEAARPEGPATLQSLLFPSQRSLACAVVDASACPGFLEQLERHKPESACLFGGQLSPEALTRAPYLVRLKPDCPFTAFLLSGWGRAWCIYAHANASMPVLREHFRTFLMVSDPSGNPLFFRYYDPRVFAVYLPTVNEQEADYIFGPVDAFLFEEEETRSILHFTRHRGELRIERLPAPSPAG